MITQWTVFARNARTKDLKNFLIESVDQEIAKALFIIERPEWEVEACQPAQCFVSGDHHKGGLSVWGGKEGRTAILCQYHGDSLPQ